MKTRHPTTESETTMMPARSSLLMLFTLVIMAWVTLPGSITAPAHGASALAQLRASA
jgi:hypothetical protein